GQVVSWPEDRTKHCGASNVVRVTATIAGAGPVSLPIASKSSPVSSSEVATILAGVAVPPSTSDRFRYATSALPSIAITPGAPLPSRSASATSRTSEPAGSRYDTAGGPVDVVTIATYWLDADVAIALGIASSPACTTRGLPEPRTYRSRARTHRCPARRARRPR